ncbi:MAG: enoyl-CoA hydratase [Armatimonadota bacterium]|nr:enoyl-CoA hydratase [Armatimonadota bacterium]MDR7469493.1 enoyl-CoA hydratase [Armatimonadota bacterium]MDR7475444.1 enoyl-CoA hydratase [Armatimonadota bacterium]
MSYRTVLLQTDGPIATITLNRPEKLNALTITMAEELCALIDEISRDGRSRVIILTGAGRVFSAGGDLTEMNRIVESALSTDRGARSFLNVARALHGLRLPTIARINGDVYGGACGIIMACDLRIALEDARFGFVFTRVGLSGADAGVSYFLPRLVGLGKATELLMLGKTIDAREAERIGLVQQAVPAHKLDETVDGLARSLAEGPPLALTYTKRALRDGLDRDLHADFEYEAHVQGLCFLSQDHREGLQAFMEKRRPVFKGI